MLKKITSEESLRDNSTAELDALKHRDWVRQNICRNMQQRRLNRVRGFFSASTCALTWLLRPFASQARLWVQLMKELRQGVKLKKVQEQPFNTLPTEFSLTPFEMLMQDIRARNFQLRKVMVRTGARVLATERLKVIYLVEMFAQRLG